MNAVATSFEPFSTSKRQNPFIFCDEEDRSDGISYENKSSNYSLENTDNDANNIVFSLSFHASGEVTAAQRECASNFSVSIEEETTATMAPGDAIKSKRCSSFATKSDGISDDSSSSSKPDNDRSHENGGDEDEKKSSSRKTNGVSVLADENDAKADYQIEIRFFQTNHGNKDFVPPENDRERREELREDPISDVTSTGVVSKKRGNRRYRSQNSTKKRWKQLDAGDMGFNLSSLPRLPDESNSETNDEWKILEDPNVAASESVIEISDVDSDRNSAEAASSASSERERNNDEESNVEELDDEAFFAYLGVDVHDNGKTFPTDDIWQWDGVRYNDPPSLHPASSKDNTGTKQKSDTSVKTWPPGSHGKKSVRNSHVIDNKYVCNMSKRDIGILFDSGCVHSTRTYLRPDRHRRKMKYHKAIKSKHAKVSDILYNSSKKQVYMHHRLIKLHDIELDFLQASVRRRSQPTAMPKTKVAQDWIKGIRIKNCRAGQSRASQPAPAPQNLNHALAETNVPVDFEMDLVSFLLSVQHRELTPEDYEMLLRLDDSVKAKTVSKNILDTLKTETIEEGDVIDTMCAVCMEPYTTGQVRKFLPCQHDFHNECINTWLNNSSQNCPLDGLPVAGS